MNRRSWPAALALLTLVILASYLWYTERLVRQIREEAAHHTRMYALVQQGLLSLEPGAELRALLALQETLTELGIPIVAVNAEGEPYAAVNLPFRVDLADPESRARLLEYAESLDRATTPIVEPGVATVHFGVQPVLLWLRWVPWLQVAGAVVMLGIAFALVRANMRAERERLWAAMARELAHQMGTPLSSLVGWVELLALPDDARSEMASVDRIASEIETDVDRLERVSRRFELIGKPAVLVPIEVDDLLRELEAYLAPRLPRLGAGVQIRVRARKGLAPVRANRVLLVWALENLVRNALDALAGRGGRIRVAAASARDGWVRISVADDGPGIPAAVRDRLFEPGLSTKPGGWGVGLSLTRRIVEAIHGGRITVRARRSGGTIFEVELPAAGDGKRRALTSWSPWKRATSTA